MSSSMKEFQHLKISLEDIKTATKDFTECIGQGGFGKVYRGELLISKVFTMVAVKRLDNELGQGAPEFWREIMLLTRYKHENLVSLLGFCDEGREKILVYEYLPKKSLDLYLISTNLTWNQRLRICLGAAHGLEYLHEPFEGSQQRVLHRDIKSANILLDQNWKAKIADFGLSKFGPANQEYTFLYSIAVGTLGYCDPLYVQKGFLTKESDVYSFGVVLFEVLCGRHCVLINYEDIRRFLPVLARKCYEENILDTIVDNSLKKQISPECLQRFSKIAYQCLRIDQAERPSVTKIVKELEISLEYQEQYEIDKERKLKLSLMLESDSDEYWEAKLPRDLDEIITMFKIPIAICTIKKELFSYLHTGILFDGGNKFFWINNDGENCELISARTFLLELGYQCDQGWVFQRDFLRFSSVAEYAYDSWEHNDTKLYNIRCEINTSMLSRGTMYAASLVFKYREKPNEHLEQLKMISIKWKTEKLSVRSTHMAELTSDNWYRINMWYFNNHRPNADFDIVIDRLLYFNKPAKSDLLIYGIEFQPIEMMQHEDIEEFKNLSIREEEEINDKNIDDDDDDDDDKYWEKKLPVDYKRYIEMADKPLDCPSKKELYLRLCEGFLGNDGRLWFSLCKLTGGICSLVGATTQLHYATYNKIEYELYLSESRFGKVIKLESNKASERFYFGYEFWSSMVSPQYIYACYLVFKFKDNQTLPDETCLFRVECKLDKVSQGKVYACVTLPSMNIPTIKPNNDYGSHDSSNIPRVEGIRVPKIHMTHLGYSRIEERKDGWMEVMLFKPLHCLKDHMLVEVKLKDNKDWTTHGMIIEGIEFKACI